MPIKVGKKAINWDQMEIAVTAGYKAMKANTEDLGDTTRACACLLWMLVRSAEERGLGDAGELMANQLNATKAWKGRIVPLS